MFSMSKRKISLAVLGCGLILVAAGCSKKRIPPPPSFVPKSEAQAEPQRAAGEARTAQERPAVNEEEARKAAEARAAVTIDDFLKRLQDAYFDFDKAAIRDDAQAALVNDSDALKRALEVLPSATIEVQGNCDERGSEQYNLALGDRRAKAAKEFLTTMGVPTDRITVISYGKERPQCAEHNEDCWQKNRRAHFSRGES